VPAGRKERFVGMNQSKKSENCNRHTGSTSSGLLEIVPCIFIPEFQVWQQLQLSSRVQRNTDFNSTFYH
jgi:hypothetical protein